MNKRSEKKYNTCIQDFDDWLQFNDVSDRGNDDIKSRVNVNLRSYCNIKTVLSLYEDLKNCNTCDNYDATINNLNKWIDGLEYVNLKNGEQSLSEGTKNNVKSALRWFMRFLKSYCKGEHTIDRGILNKLFLKRLKTQNRTPYNSIKLIFPISRIITLSGDAGTKFLETMRSRIIVYVSGSLCDDKVIPIKYGDITAIKITPTNEIHISYKVDGCKEDRNGYIMEPPLSEENIGHIRNICSEYKNEPCPVIAQERNQYGWMALDHVIPITYVLNSILRQSNGELYNSLYNLSESIKGKREEMLSENIDSKKINELIFADQNIKNLCRKVFEDMNAPEVYINGFHPLFYIQLTSADFNLGKSDSI